MDEPADDVANAGDQAAAEPDQKPVEAVLTEAALPVDVAAEVPVVVAARIDVPAPIPIPEVVDVHDLDWTAVRDAVSPPAIRVRMRATVEAFEALLDRSGGPGLLFDSDRKDAEDRAIHVGTIDPAAAMWIIGDLHGDLLALEAALAAIEADGGIATARIVFLGDLFDDEGLGLELLLRVFELILAAPDRVCLIVGNHDEALTYDGNRFASSVSPSDFADSSTPTWYMSGSSVQASWRCACPRGGRARSSCPMDS